MMSDNSDDPLHKKIPSHSPSDDSFEIQASSLEGKIVDNLKLLKSLIRGEKVRLNQFVEEKRTSQSQKDLAIESLQKKIIDEFLRLDLRELALLVVPKKLQEECFDILVKAWRKKISEEFSQTLTLLHLKFSKESFRALVIALSLTVSLKALRMDHCHLTAFESKLLAVFIKVHPTIQVLHLDDNPLTDEGFESLASALKLNETLIHLSLNKTDIGDDSLSDLEQLVSRGQYQSLSLKENAFSSEACRHLIELAFEKNCQLILD